MTEKSRTSHNQLQAARVAGELVQTERQREREREKEGLPPHLSH